eukprot:TRINITY_DN5929_c0_g1_i3.p2 TRINITY_DN5929_c0_g1~~TRINITY_DN5929_c0_g1_i3.p2  ORF type:complete len:265 (-),score=77.58 TRINITY_DN5929_c0_g1_i3:1263-2030(-)
MDHAVEQADELEALEAILAEDLKEFDGNTPTGWNPVGKIYIIPIIPEVENGMEITMKMELIFAHTEEYPEEPPLIRLRSDKGVSDADVAQAFKAVESEIEDNLGTPMIYTLVTVAQDWLTSKMDEIAQGKTQEVAEKVKREQEEEKMMQARRIGTPVTVEKFMEWQKQFMAEMALKRVQLGGADDDSKQNKLTGKQWFLQREAEMRGKEDRDEDEDYIDEDELGEEETDFDIDDEDFDDIDEDEMLEQYLAQNQT